MKVITQQELAVILEYTHDAVVAVNKDGRISLINLSAQSLTGLRARDVLGQAIAKTLPGLGLERVLETGRGEFGKQLVLGAITVTANLIPVFDENSQHLGAVALFREVAGDRAIARQLTDLRDMGSLLKDIIRSTQDAISVVDEKGIGILINPAYTRITGLTEADVLNKPATVDIAEGESMHYKVLKTGEPVWGVPMKVGPMKKEVVVNVAPIFHKGELKGSVAVIHDLSEIKKLTRELEDAKRRIRLLEEAKYTFDDILGESEALRAALQQAKRAAVTPATVLLRGESGTGKELFAHAIHNASQRSKGRFIKVNCAAIPDNLLESELFGYEEGAFTGASRGGKKGLFEEADEGTIFLDEIGNLSLNLQTKLLRILQEKELRHIGGNKDIPVNVRVLAATNANLEQKVQEGAFREDLFYRLNFFPIFIPPLRLRKGDIPILAYHLVKKFNQEFGRHVVHIHDETMNLLEGYKWPGNVRELENVIGRAIINMNFYEDTIQPYHLPPLNSEENGQVSQSSASGLTLSGVRDYMGETYEEIMAGVEKELLLKVLSRAGGNKTQAAKALGLPIRTFYYKLAKHGIT